MDVMHSEWKGRINHWVRTLKDDFYKPLGELKWEAFCTMEQLSIEAASINTFEPVEPGFSWGKTYEYCWLRSKIILPAEAEGERIVLNLNPGGESALFVNGEEFGTYRADWVNEQHHFMEDNTLSTNAAAGASYEVLMETYAGHYYPECRDGGCATGPVLPGAFKDPKIDGSRTELGVCTYGIWNEEAYQLYMDVDTLAKLLLTLDESTLRAAKIAEALELFTLTVDFEQERAGRIASYKEARESLSPVLTAVNGTTMPRFYAVGNAHLDLAWLWPMAETYRKTARTFAAQLRLIEENPEYKFIQSQPAAYEMCRNYYPKLFERIKEAIKGGQWIADGAMWVEPDTNMAGGEALIRQLIHGKRYYREVLGVESEVLWLPDTFGYTASLPQILKGCGVRYLVTQKIFWSYNEGEQFPYHYFSWEGMDGSTIVSFLPTSYTYRTDPAEINNVWKQRTQVRDLEAFLFPFGYGDGGGGPARDYVEYAKRQKDLEGGVRVKMAGPREFFDDMDQKGGPKHTYTGELYFSAHRGTYTTQAMVKKNNRKSELALRDMELWGVLASQKGKPYPMDQADALWKELLLHQFHDILPGSCIARVYEEAEEAYGKLLYEAAQITNDELETLLEHKKDAVTVFNSLGFERTAVVGLPKAFADGAVTMEGETVCVDSASGSVKALVHIPSMGAVSLIPSKEKKSFEMAVARETETGFCMENPQVLVQINSRGEVVSYKLKTSGREFAAAPMNRFRLYKDVPRLFDAWDIDSNYILQEVEAASNIQVKVLESGLEAVLMVTGRISHSAYTQKIRLEAAGTRLIFETTFDWKELHRLLKVSFPVDVYAENAINEIQFGYIERPTHRSRNYEKDRFEVCNHRYSALCDGAHGAAVLNDCKYGISMNKHALELTLLRGSSSPEMRADNREHTFTYGFTAWEGGFMDSDVVKQGYELNTAPVVKDGAAGKFSFAGVDRDNLIIDTVKPAEDGSGDVILRIYEAKKASVTGTITCNLDSYQASLCNMLEEKQQALDVHENQIKLSFRAFEIKTIRISKCT